MSLLDSSKLFREIRKRKEWSRMKMLDHLDVAERTLRRIEGRHSTPRAETLGKLAEVEPLLDTTFVLPYLDGQPIEAYSLCDEVVHALDNGKAPPSGRRL